MYKKKSKIIVLFAGILLAFLLSGQSVYAQSDKVQVSVDCGIGGIVRCGRMLYVKINTKNNGYIKKGTMIVTALCEDANQAAYEQPVELEAGEATQTEFFINLNQDITGLLLQIKQENGNTVVEQKIPIETVNYGTYPVVGILSQSPLLLDYLGQFGTKLVILDKNNLPDNYMGLDALDAIVVDNFNLDKLSSQKVEAIKEWTGHGGTLILGGDTAGLLNIEVLEKQGMLTLSKEIDYRTFYQDVPVAIYSEAEKEAMLAQAKKYEEERLSMIEYIKENSKTQTFLHSYVGETMNYEKTEDKPKIQGRNLYFYEIEGSIPLKQYKDCVFLETSEYQEGIIKAVHFQLSADTRKETTGQLALAHLLLNHLSGENEERRATEELGYYNTFPFQYARTVSFLKKPNLTVNIGLLLGYLVLIGPVTYLILKKKKRRILLWVVLPVLGITWLVLLYFTNRGAAITASYAQYIDILKCMEDGTIHRETYANIISPKIKNETHVFSGIDSLSIGGFGYPPYFGGDSSESKEKKIEYEDTVNTAVITNSGNNLKLSIKEQPVFSKQQIVILSTLKEETVNNTLFIANDGIKGTIKNPYPGDLSDCFIYYHGCYIEVGSLKEGEEIQIDFLKMEYYPCFDDALSSDSFISAWIADKEAAYTAAGAQIDGKSLNRRKAYLFGIVKDTDGSVLQIAKNPVSEGSSILTAQIPVISPQEDELFIPDLLDLAMNETMFRTGYYTQYSYSPVVNATVALPAGYKIKSLCRLSIFPEKEEFFEIYLYRWENGAYDLVTVDCLNEIAPYVNEDGIIKVRYEGAESSSGIYEMPVISANLEKINAGDY